MKKTILLLTTSCCLATVIPAQAQFNSPGGATPDSALHQIFGTNLNFSAHMNVELNMPERNNDITMAGKIYFSHGKSRTEMDMENMKGTKLPPQAVERMKAMGMDKLISISLPDAGQVYLIYPGLESYAKITVPKKTEDTKAQVDTTKLGKETVDGHPCVKKQYVVTENGQKLTMLAWLASDLKDYPVKIKIDAARMIGGKPVPTTTTMHFSDIDTATPSASLFEPPADYHAYTNMRTMMQTEMMKKMGGGGMGMPPNHPGMPAGHPNAPKTP